MPYVELRESPLKRDISEILKLKTRILFPRANKVFEKRNEELHQNRRPVEGEIEKGFSSSMEDLQRIVDDMKKLRIGHEAQQSFHPLAARLSGLVRYGDYLQGLQPSNIDMMRQLPSNRHKSTHPKTISRSASLQTTSKTKANKSNSITSSIDIKYKRKLKSTRK
jgi:hypothetical protein